MILKSRIWKICKLAKSYNNNTHDGCDTVSDVFCPHLRDFYGNFKEFIKIALTPSIFELEKCSFFLNGSEFRQKLIGAIIRVLIRQQRA